MGKKKIQASVPQNKILLDAIIKGMQDKKGADIMVLDFSKIGGAVCDAFVICTGNSNTQVEAIADAVHEAVKKATGENPFHTEGSRNAEWIVMDYVDIVAHIFQPETRSFYQLEKLWADAESRLVSSPS
ncbi:MAG: ribosome silencing factor [Bacteroidota bacterium]|jgi:ribosome-associated protein